MSTPTPIELSPGAPLADYQRYIHDLEAMHGWLEVDLVHNCFLLGEEVGELFKAVRRYERLFEQAESASAQSAPAGSDAARAHVAEEIVDVMNYLLALANRLDIDVEQAFREKNARNQTRRWS